MKLDMTRHFMKNNGVGFVHPDIDDYAAAMSAPESPLRKALAKETRKRFPRDAVMMIGQQEAAVLQVLLLAINAKRVLEIGTFTGYSAIAMWEVLGERGGEVVTIELSRSHANVAHRYFQEANQLKAGVKLLVGNARNLVTLLNGPFDAAFIDAEKTGYIDYWQKCKRIVRHGGLLIADNTLSCKRKKTDDPEGKAIAEFNEFVRNDPDVHFALTTIRDGMTIAYRK